MRPRTLDEFIGQEKFLGPGKSLRVQIENDNLGSMLFWGPPGCGKTTLARLIARLTRSEFVSFSAVLAGIKEIKEVMAVAEYKSRIWPPHHRLRGRSSPLQQSAAGRVSATRRGRPHHLYRRHHRESFLRSNLAAALAHQGLRPRAANDSADRRTSAPRARRQRTRTGREKIEASDEVLFRIASFANGDARSAYNTLELAVRGAQPDDNGASIITKELLEDVLQRKLLRYDKAGEEHFNLISALHKSVRNSDPDAALYWLARMLESGEDPLYLARRMVRMASEDIGLAEPGALAVTLAARRRFRFSRRARRPSGPRTSRRLSFARAKIQCALHRLRRGQEDVQKTEADPVPLHLRNAVTGLMKNIGYGQGYKYAHNLDDKVTDMTCLPDNLAGRAYYKPTDQGFEARLRQRLDEIRKIKSRTATQIHEVSMKRLTLFLVSFSLVL